jgi:translation initiation factor IF-3
VRVIAPDGQQLGIKSLPDALKLAQELDLDLVEVAPLANPPVCRVMDFKKWQYEEKQKAKESRKKSSSISIKEMKYRPKIGQGDFDTKTRKVAEFLNDGHKVKVTIMFRGREVFHPELGAKILDQIAVAVTEIGKVEAHARLDGRNMTMVLAPDRKAHATPKQREHRPRTSAGSAASPNGSPAEAVVPMTDVVVSLPVEEAPTPVTDVATPPVEVTAPVAEQPESDTNPA